MGGGGGGGIVCLFQSVVENYDLQLIASGGTGAKNYSNGGNGGNGTVAYGIVLTGDFVQINH